MFGYAVAHFPRQIKPLSVLLQNLDDSQALFIVIEATRHQLVQHLFASVSKRCVPEIMPKRDRFGKILIKVKYLRHSARYLRHLKGVG